MRRQCMTRWELAIIGGPLGWSPMINEHLCEVTEARGDRPGHAVRNKNGNR